MKNKRKIDQEVSLILYQYFQLIDNISFIQDPSYFKEEENFGEAVDTDCDTAYQHLLGVSKNTFPAIKIQSLEIFNPIMILFLNIMKY